MVGAIIGGVASLAGGLFGSSKARRAAKRARREAAKLEKKLTELEKNRQEIINPYQGVQDLSSMLSNPFANLSIATQAAEMQIEESDIALANTLDTIRATGASAGGATALAQAALQAKKSVAASIESQEVANERQRAAGEATLQQQKMSEQQRLQQADVAGRQFVFGMTEQREQQQLDRVSNQISALRGQAASASRDSTAALTGGIGAAASLFGGIDFNNR
jgi:hypothetical protein